MDSLKAKLEGNSGEFATTFTQTEVFDDSALISASDGCNNKDSLLYVQFSCVQTPDEMRTKYEHLSIVASVGVFVASLFLIVIYYMKRYSKMNQLDWDIQTITPGDYTLQYEITDEAYHWFLNTIYYPGSFEQEGTSIALALKNYMKAELEKMLTEKLNEMRSSGKDMSNIKI